MRRIAVLSLSILLLMILALTTADGRGYEGRVIEPIVRDRGSFQDIEIRTELSDYIFSTENGELRSVFLHFAPYGLHKLELITDTSTDSSTLARSYVGGGVFPFTLGLAQGEGPWDYRLLKRDAEQVRLEFSKDVGDLQIKKIYTIRNGSHLYGGFRAHHGQQVLG